jgi:hypothetical protein
MALNAGMKIPKESPPVVVLTAALEDAERLSNEAAKPRQQDQAERRRIRELCETIIPKEPDGRGPDPAA